MIAKCVSVQRKKDLSTCPADILRGMFYTETIGFEREAGKPMPLYEWGDGFSLLLKAKYEQKGNSLMEKCKSY